MSALPSQRWPAPIHAPAATAEQIAKRADEVLAYWRDKEDYEQFGWALGQLADTDETCDTLHELFKSDDVLEFGNAIKRMIGEAKQAKATQYATDELNGDLAPHQILRRIPEGYVSHAAAMAKAQAHAAKYRAMVAATKATQP